MLVKAAPGRSLAAQRMTPAITALSIIGVIVFGTVMFALASVRRFKMDPHEYIVGSRSFGASRKEELAAAAGEAVRARRSRTEIDYRWLSASNCRYRDA